MNRVALLLLLVALLVAKPVAAAQAQHTKEAVQSREYVKNTLEQMQALRRQLDDMLDRLKRLRT